MAKIIMITSHKGGVGKTTTAINLGCLFAKEGKQVLVIDTDPNKSAIVWARNGTLPIKVVPEAQSARLLQKEQFDIIIFDTPGRPNKEEIAELAEGSDLVILPTTPRTLAIATLKELAGSLSETQCTFKVLICDSPPAPQTDGADAYEGINGMGIPVFKRLIRSFKAYEHAANAGIPVYEVKRVGKVAWRDWEVLREEIEL